MLASTNETYRLEKEADCSRPPTKLDRAVRGPLVLVALCRHPARRSGRARRRSSGASPALRDADELAVLLAFAGTSAFALNLVLGARLRPVEALFGGLDRMYRAHRVARPGRLRPAARPRRAHPRGRATISTDARPRPARAGRRRTVFAGVLAFAAMAVAIVLTLFVRLGHEVFVYVQRSFGFVFLVATYHVFTTAARRGLAAR